MSPIDVRRLVNEIRSGEPSAYERLYSCVRTAVVAKLALPPQVDREELVVDTVTSVWKALRTLRDDQKLLSFATTVARRLASRKAREFRRSPLADRDGARAAADPSAGNLEREELLGRLEGSLRAADQRLFRLLYVAGVSAPEARCQLGLDDNNFRKRKHRLHQRLRRRVSGPGQ